MKNNTFEYKGYVGSIEWSEDDKLFHGRVIGIRSLLSYEGTNINELRQDFIECIDDYLETCKKKGWNPQVPYKGSFNVRVTSDLHRQISEKAMDQGISLNKFVQNALEVAVK